MHHLLALRSRNRRGWADLLVPALLLVLLLVCRGAAAATTSPGAVVVEDRVALTLRASVGSISAAERAGIINSRIEHLLSTPESQPELLEVRPGPDEGYLLVAGEFPLLEVTAADAEAEGTEPGELAGRWRDTLRERLVEAKPLHRPHRQEHRITFVPLLTVAVLAFLVPLLSGRFRRFPLPVVVGEILVGICIGRSGLGLVHYDSWLQFLAEFGFTFLMFLSGLEVDFGLLRAGNPDASVQERRPGWRQSPPVIAGLTFGITLALATLVSLGLQRAGLIDRPWLMILLLSTTSLGLVVPILKERGETATPFGQTLLLSALVADFATMVLITLVAGLLSGGSTLRLFLVLLLLGAFAAAVRLGLWAARSERVMRLVRGASTGTAQLPVRGSLALMLVFVALSEQLGTEVILGAFLAGVLLSLLVRDQGADLRHKLDALGFGFFIPVFFIMVGVRFDLPSLMARPEGLRLAGWLILGAFLIKLGAALPFRWLVPMRQALAGGMLISSRLSLIIAAAEIGLSLGLFSEAVHTSAICVALITCAIGPLGFQLLMPHPTATPPDTPSLPTPLPVFPDGSLSTQPQGNLRVEVEPWQLN